MMKTIFLLQALVFEVLGLLFGHNDVVNQCLLVLGINYLVLHFAGFKLIMRGDKKCIR